MTIIKAKFEGRSARKKISPVLLASIIDSVTEVFKPFSEGVIRFPDDNIDWDRDFYSCAQIPFFGRKMAASMNLNLSKDLLKETVEHTFGEMDAERLDSFKEMACELANHVAGKIKTGLEKIEIHSVIGLPKLVTRESQQHLISGPIASIPFAVKGKIGFVELCVGSVEYDSRNLVDGNQEILEKV